MKRLAAFFAIALCYCAMADERRVDVARFSQRDMSGWEAQLFSGETRYTLENEGSGYALRADSHGSASGLVRRIRIDLAQTPYLNWSWKVNNILSGNDERSRAGDDYPVRIYVIFSGGLFFWRTRAINYVWSSHQSVSAHWPNAYTRQTIMIAVDAGSPLLNQWVNHRRNIREDYRQLFGEDIVTAEAVAIMSDTDNTGLSASGWYGDIWFSE